MVTDTVLRGFRNMIEYMVKQVSHEVAEELSGKTEVEVVDIEVGLRVRQKAGVFLRTVFPVVCPGTGALVVCSRSWTPYCKTFCNGRFALVRGRGGGGATRGAVLSVTGV